MMTSIKRFQKFTFQSFYFFLALKYQYQMISLRFHSINPTGGIGVAASPSAAAFVELALAAEPIIPSIIVVNTTIQ